MSAFARSSWILQSGGRDHSLLRRQSFKASRSVGTQGFNKACQILGFHANDAAATIDAFRQFGVPAIFVADSLTAVDLRVEVLEKSALRVRLGNFNARDDAERHERSCVDCGVIRTTEEAMTARLGGRRRTLRCLWRREARMIASCRDFPALELGLEFDDSRFASDTVDLRQAAPVSI